MARATVDCCSVGDVGVPLLESAATIKGTKALGFRNFVPKDAFTCYGYFFVKRDHGPLADGAASFNTPRWRIVVKLVQSQALLGQMALAELYRICWYSLYIFARRCGHLPEDAHDLTRGFFLQLLERRTLSSVDRLKRKFRSLLLASFQNYFSGAVDHARRLKRAESKGPIELDAEDAERRYRREPVESLSAERIFDRRWAMTVLGEARNKLRQEDAAAGKASTFKRRRVVLYPNNSVAWRSYDELANQLHLSTGGVKALIPSLWNQYNGLLREDVGRTVSDPAGIDEEIPAPCDALLHPKSG